MPENHRSFPRESSFMCFHPPAIFLSETGQFIPKYTRVFVLLHFVPVHFSYFLQYLTEIRHSIFALCCHTCPSRIQEIFFYYFSIILPFRISLSIPIAVVVFACAILPERLKKIASLARRSAFTLSIELLSDPPYISELLACVGMLKQMKCVVISSTLTLCCMFTLG